jgi:signal transduction histidine kinase
MPGPTADHQLLKHLAEGALVCDAKGVIHDANEAAAKILGKPASELIGEDLQSILDDPRWERMVGSLRLALAMAGGTRAKPPAPETTLYVNDHIIRAKLVPIHESQPGTAALIAALFQDVSAENEGWRARDETLADLSHKLRGPMTAIASYSDLLLGDTVGVVDAMQRRYLQRIRQGIQRLEAALNELEEEPDNSGQRATPAPTYPITEVIHQAVDAAQKVLSLEGVNIVKNIAQDLPSVPMDPNYVNRILADLLTAAGTCTNCGDSVHVGTQVQLEDARPKHLIILIQSGTAPRRDSSIMDSDENVREAMSLAEGAGGRVWIDDEADGSIVISFLLPIAEPVLSGRP